ncbi:2-dehydro-3-deoxygalactonokinase [Brenneria izbisi]|uniref:2-dehydro-3-deoxygalactonokinase n=1 Tax=Brenneria izbisi TaxID=2939450 RepID=A0AA41XY99_9GAMM|nr:2-dehydro-3-deoxygalactonokinase [Brenneria izbisi]MCV9878942.1 2-dehydro-3-deoxygalactonokinase [Brenneria izbisi]MCV9882394.1 2-dehydro-3-deoxygalactonokinase [Brenneria izbisi]
MSESYIAVDWGSTNLRAWLYLDGVCIDTMKSEAGVTRLNGQTPRQVFQHLVAPWRQHNVPVVMAGMIGSNAGWLSVPYLPCPTRLTQVAHRLTRVEEARPLSAWIVPGLSIERDDNCNVIRGEETQLIGAYRECPAPLYLMPGTHSKWVRTDDSNVLDFRTVMTGELHHLLMTHSLIGVGLGEQQPAPQAFQQGLALAFHDDNIVRCLFETRAAHVLGRLDKHAVSDWLSGLLIGNEVSQMQRHYLVTADEPITLVGSPALTARYEQALSLAGLRWQLLDGDRAFQAGIRSMVNELAD